MRPLLVVLAFVFASAADASAQVRLVRDLNLGSASSRPTSLTPFEGELYFVADDGSSGREVWHTDGASLARLTDVNPAEDGYAQIIGTTDDHLYFYAADSTWATDGTKVWSLGAIAPQLSASAIVGGEQVLLIRASSDEVGSEPWVLEEGSARLIADLNPGAFGSHPSQFLQVGEQVYFKARDDEDEPDAWWVTDGVDVARVTGTPVGEDELRGIAGYDGKLYFSAVTPEHGREVWTAEGTAAQLAADLYSGPQGSSRWYGFGEVYNGELLFFDYGNLSLWATDGSTFTNVASFDPNPPGVFFSSADFMGQAQGELVVRHCDWNEDGSGLCRILRGNGYYFEEVGEVATPDEGVWALRTAGQRAFFLADGEGTGRELWELGAEGIDIVVDLNPGASWGVNSAPLPVGDQLYFAGSDGDSGIELWALDLTATDAEPEGAQPVATAFTEVFPNPVRGLVQAQYALSAPQTVTLELIDLLGRRVRSEEIGRQAAGAHDVRIDMGGLRAGLYILRLRGDAGAEATRRVVVL